MISIVYHTSQDRHHSVTNICEIRSITKAKDSDLWKIEFYYDNGERDWWMVGLDTSEVEDGIPDSVMIGGTVYEGRAGMTKLAKIPLDILNTMEETYRSLEEL